MTGDSGWRRSHRLTGVAWILTGEQMAVRLNDGGLVIWNLSVVRAQLAKAGWT